MPSPNFGVNPTADPNRFLGLDPIGGDDVFIRREEIREQVFDLLDEFGDNDTHYMYIQRTFERIKEIHPKRGSDGTWRVPLEIEGFPTSIEQGGEVMVIVTDSAEYPVSDARILIDDRLIARTDNAGRSKVRLNQSGTIEIAAGKSISPKIEYADTATTVTVEE